MPEPAIFAMILVAAAALIWFFNRSGRQREAARSEPSNDLERLLVEQVGTTALTEPMRDALAAAVLLGVENADAPGVPMDFTATFPAEFADSLEGHVVTEEGKIQFGPYVVCFSSPHVVEGVAADPVMGGLVTQVGTVREFAAREVFQSALDEQIDVILNPFYGVARRFSQEEIRGILGACGD